MNSVALLFVVFTFISGTIPAKAPDKGGLSKMMKKIKSDRLDNERLAGEYYDCLKERLEHYLTSPETVQAHMVLVGDDVTLPCGFCKQWNREYAWYNVYWSRSLLSERKLREVPIDHDRFSLNEQQDLFI